MNITLENIEERRTPSELSKFVERYKSEVSEKDLANGLQRKGEYKVFIEEVLPLSRFCDIYLDDSYEIEPVRGNQGFDAKVYRFSKFQFNIEVTLPHDGAQRAVNTRELISKGISRFKISSPKELLEIRKIIEKTCKDKSVKDYSDTVLVIYVNTGAVSDHEIEEFGEAMEKIERDANNFDYKAKEVYLYFGPFGEIRKINA